MSDALATGRKMEAEGNQGMSDALLNIKDLKVTFPVRKGRIEVVKNISFRLGRERLGIVGESGSGKSMTGRAILRLIRAPGKMTAQELQFKNIDLLGLSEKKMRVLRGAGISMIMQDPKYSLNPVMTVGAQISEALEIHERISGKEKKERVNGMLESVRINDPGSVAEMYPHQLSGGMGQRVMIAMMLIPRPDILIADEPTSALDVSVQRQVLALINDLVRERGMGLILISHDIKLVSAFCDRILVMYDGRIVEECTAARLGDAKHPYTRGLLASIPRMNETRDQLPVPDRKSRGL